MKAYVYVSLKKSVLDPQGKTIQGALHKMGYKGLEGVRQGKFFEITLDGLNKSDAQAEVERIARVQLWERNSQGGRPGLVEAPEFVGQPQRKRPRRGGLP